MQYVHHHPPHCHCRGVLALDSKREHWAEGGATWRAYIAPQTTVRTLTAGRHGRAYAGLWPDNMALAGVNDARAALCGAADRPKGKKRRKTK